MPCIVYDDDEANAPQTSKLMTKELAKFAGWVCDLCGILEGNKISLPADIAIWYNQHSLAEEEKIKKEALAKLTSREKRVLGLTDE